ncbi:GntR family transcriptional regulator [bacterium]|nr:MAG: GntR family transcriptional regulator [bacterium]
MMTGPMEATRSYRDVADALREKIRSGEHRSGNLLPTERELQTAFGVSRSTVRRALQNLAESGWAEVRPNRGTVGRMGRMTPTSTFIGFVDDADSAHQSLFFRLSSVLEAHGLHLAMVDSCGRGTEGAIELCVERGFGAAVVWSKTGTPDLQRIESAAAQLPIVAVDHGIKGLGCDVVKAQMYEGARQVVRHLVQQGRRRIAITGWLDALDTTQERFAGYLHGLYEEGIEPRARDFVFSAPSQDQPDLELLRFRLSRPDRPDAVFMTSDIHVAEVAACIREAGLRIPEDVALVGAGNDVPFQIGRVGLTTLSIDWPGAAEAIAERIVHRLREPHGLSVETTVPVRLIVRGSCGAPRREWMDSPFLPSRLQESSISSLISVPPTWAGLSSTQK